MHHGDSETKFTSSADLIGLLRSASSVNLIGAAVVACAERAALGIASSYTSHSHRVGASFTAASWRECEVAVAVAATPLGAAQCRWRAEGVGWHVLHAEGDGWHALHAEGEADGREVERCALRRWRVRRAARVSITHRRKSIPLASKPAWG